MARGIGQEFAVPIGSPLRRVRDVVENKQTTIVAREPCTDEFRALGLRHLFQPAIQREQRRHRGDYTYAFSVQFIDSPAIPLSILGCIPISEDSFAVPSAG